MNERYENNSNQNSIIEQVINATSNAIGVAGSVVEATGNVLPRSLSVVGEVATAAAEVMHHPSRSMTERIVCGTARSVAQGVASAPLYSAAASVGTLVGAAVAPTPVTAPFSAATVAAATVLATEPAINQITAPIGNLADRMCRAAFDFSGNVNQVRDAQKQTRQSQVTQAAAERQRQQTAQKQKLKNLTGPERCYQSAIVAAKNLTGADNHFQLARAAFYKKRNPGSESMKFEEASKECDKALALDPKHADALKLQLCIGETNLTSNSQKYYRSALIAAKNLTGADKHFQLARVALFKPRRTCDQWKKYEEASKEANQALKLNPKHVGAVQLKNNIVRNTSINSNYNSNKQYSGYSSGGNRSGNHNGFFNHSGSSSNNNGGAGGKELEINVNCPRGGGGWSCAKSNF